MIRLVTEEGRSQRDVAQRFSVKPSLITRLVKQEKLEKNSIAQLEEKLEAKRARNA